MAAGRPPFTAVDIQTLYKKVMKGFYPRIPLVYSNDLVEVISQLIRLDPRDRPSASQLLNHPLVQRHYNEEISTSMVWEVENDELLSTIRLPSRNYKRINEMLPKAQYDRKNKQ